MDIKRTHYMYSAYNSFGAEIEEEVWDGSFLYAYIEIEKKNNKASIEKSIYLDKDIY